MHIGFAKFRAFQLMWRLLALIFGEKRFILEELNENVQSKTVFFKATHFSKSGNYSSELLKVILKFCTINKLFEFKDVLTKKISAKYAIFQHLNVFWTWPVSVRGLIGLSKINSFKLFVTYKNLECFCYDYLPCFNLNVTALLALPPFYFRMFEINPFLYVPPSSTVIELFGCLPFLIAIIRLEVCDVIIMLQFVIVGLYTFSIVTY